MPEIDSSWIKPGAEVIVYCERPHSTTHSSANIRRSTVKSVAGKSFLVDGIVERIKLDTLRSKDFGDWNRWRYAVVKPDSDKGRELAAQQRLAGLRAKAVAAVDAWNTGDGRDDPDRLNAAIAFLADYRSALGIQEGNEHE